MDFRSVTELQRSLDQGTISSEELTREYLTRIATHNEPLNALITITEDQAIEQARAADEARSRGNAGAMTGIPLVHKDLLCTKGVRTSCGSRMLDDFAPPYDATVVARASEAGMVMLGKSNMDEFAMGSSNETSWYGPTRNPWDTERVPGGSSGGSACAVSAALAPVATCTDTGGSIRQPAALCGITGLKPTYGRVSRYGLVAYASSLDQAGAMGRGAEDVAYLTSVIAGFDPKDSTSIDRPMDDYVVGLGRSLEGLRIGLPREHFGDGLDAAVGDCIHEATRELEALGAIVKDVSLPNSGLAIPAYYVVALAEASSNLSRFDGVRYGHRSAQPRDLTEMYEQTRGEGFGAEVKRRIMVGTYALSAGYYDAYYLKAQKLRRLIRDDFLAAFEKVDVLAGPTSPFTAFPIGEKSQDPVTMYLCDVYTTAVNLAGLPALSAPAGFADNLPVGIQLIGNYFDEARLLNVAHQLQQTTDWHLRAPSGFE